MADLSNVFHGPNGGYVLELYERFLADPTSVDPGWRDFFAQTSLALMSGALSAGAVTAIPGAAASAPVSAASDGGSSVAALIRARGHTLARLNPLGADAEPDAALAQLPEDEETRRLLDIYAGTSGYEFGHVAAEDERRWLQEAVESGRYGATPAPAERRALLERLSEVEGFEKYLHKTFFGQKRFSIEGTDTMVPMLDLCVREGGASDVVIGMAHRGRLNVLTHVLGKPYAKMIAGFQVPRREARGPAPGDAEAEGPAGDVKYHMGWSTERDGVRVALAFNPSHLEFVNPVVVGTARAIADDTSRAGAPEVDPLRVLPVLIHGDAAFPGQGVVSETLNMSQLAGYQVGGTIHIIANNQIGFTTDPWEDRSTRYASDLAKGYEVPVVHVNADDPEACLAATRLGCAYRQQFRKDFLIDLVGYRRWGHNEGDVPDFTQPRLYAQISQHPTVRELYARTLAEAGAVPPDEAEQMLQGVLERMAEAQRSLGEVQSEAASPNGAHTDALPPTGVSADRLRELNEALLGRPDGWTPVTQLEKQLQRRREALEAGRIDWGHAETLAFASLLTEGTAIRLTGQDAERGTFSHRHQVLHDAASGRSYNPLQHLRGARASFEVHNSPLSEVAAMGFEYGYSVADPTALVLWEAQFGDFANGAQVIIDQFLTAGEQKWDQRSALVLLLPHGWEGQGPEHSSGRLERFLQLSAENNLRVVNCTTSAQYFHLLRRHAALLRDDPRPLVVMSPKSLLRHPVAASRLEELTQGRFQPVIPDETAGDRAGEITRLLLCSGKLYADLVGTDARQAARTAALARLEEIYPFPDAELRSLIVGLPSLQEIVWVQEEPRNMGAWFFVAPRLRELAGDLPVRYIGRPDRASPAVGSAERHKSEQTRIVMQAWDTAAPGAPSQPDASPPVLAESDPEVVATEPVIASAQNAG